MSIVSIGLSSEYDLNHHWNKMYKTAGLLYVLLAAVSANYEGYKVYSVKPANDTQIKMLGILENTEKLDFWSRLGYRSKTVDIMAAPTEQKELTAYLKNNNIQYEVLIDNVETVVQQEHIEQSLSSRIFRGKISFSKYNSHSDINGYLYQLALNYPKLVKLQDIGRSYEKRNMVVIQISLTPSANNPIIFIDAGIHAREWISIAQALYIIYELVENPANKDLLADVDWHILPVVNPDGYEYSQKTGNRLWRKTRSPQDTCVGTDGNRNFDHYWGLNGASSNPCASNYKGPKPFSEVETQNLRDYLLKIKNNAKLYLTFHSYGKYILFPWGYTSELPHDEFELRTLGKEVSDAIVKAGGPAYTVGTSTNVLYGAAGGSDDWVKGVAGIELAYTIELPGGGRIGFDLPGDAILDVVNQTFAGVVVYGKYVSVKYQNVWRFPQN
ncbi:hypothetical protein PPYR_10902 [Photinus pyralis]|uniref:Zinc carboxypeptidase A 1 n=1 Tax=Photinus pyralis TaxID=7054 RepID=A0A1Y1KCP4_PHOPY|nr:carboxypeptidase B-like [Photinus pyralis]KAB0796841.1 hypothetical protein PPYR_10902 [Photinus pyralis]